MSCVAIVLGMYADARPRHQPVVMLNTAVESGVYFYRIETRDIAASRMMTILK